MNEGKTSQLGKHDFGSLHNLTWACYHNEDILIDTDFTSQMKLNKLQLIHCFDLLFQNVNAMNMQIVAFLIP